jgi:hypothetical protein
MNIDDLAAELKKLQRGEGLGAANLGAQVGPLLSTVCGAASADDVHTLRTRLTELITRHVDVLGKDQRRAVLASLGLHPDAPFRFLKDRQKWVLDGIERYSERTVDRWTQLGMRRLAEEMVAEYEKERRRPANPFAPRSFYTAELTATVKLDLDRPEWRERRTIVALEAMDRVPVGASVPAAADGTFADVDLEVSTGETVVDWRRSRPSWYEGQLVLDRPLAPGDRYDYELRRRVAGTDVVQPYYLVTAHVRFDRLVVHVDLGDVERAWAVDGVPWPTVEDGSVRSTPPLTADASGRVSAEFTHLHLGPAYGVIWSPAGSAPAALPG